MKRKISIILVMIMIFTLASSNVFAVSLSKYNPAKSKKVKVLYHTAFTDSAQGKGDKNAPLTKGTGTMVTLKAEEGGSLQTKIGASVWTLIKKSTLRTIAPQKSNFVYGVLPSLTVKQKSVVIKGKVLKNKDTVKKYANAVGSEKEQAAKRDDGERLIWFKASDHPEVEYQGYRVYDSSNNTFVNVAIRAKLVGYSKSLLSSGAKKTKTPVIAFTNLKKEYFGGLPTIIINCIGNAQVRYRFYRIKSDGGADLNRPYQIKTNVTYDDIDAYQAISINKNQSNGFAASKAAKDDLRFGLASDAYWAINSNSGTTKKDQKGGEPDGKWDRYAMCFYIDSEEVNMIYTSNQRKVKDNKQTNSVGPPNGSWSYFSTYTTAKTPDDPVLNNPVKKVYDEKPQNDVDKTDHTHNKLHTTNESFYYTVTQTIPAELSKDKTVKFGLNSITFKDTLDSCLELNGKVNFYNGSGTDITSKFNNITGSNNPQELIYKSTDNSVINMGGKGGTIKMKIPVKVKKTKTSDDLENHVSDNLKHGTNEAHKQGDNAFLDIPNEASVTYNTMNNKNVTKFTEVVQTRMPAVPKHDLIVIKRVIGTGSSPEKKFKFTIKLFNGTQYKGKIERNDGTTENIIHEKIGTYYLKNGEKLTIPKIPQEVEFSITETGNEGYTPTFTLDNPGNCLSMYEQAGGSSKGDSLSTSGRFSMIGNYQPVTYTFVNEADNPPTPHDDPYKPEEPNYKNTYMLKTVKKEEPNTGKSFDFETILKQLTKSSYMVMKPGSNSYRITMTESGTISLKDGSNRGVPNIPIKIIRPLDKNEMIYYTDSNGTIPPDSFMKFLTKGQDGSFDFKIEWNGGYINGHYVE